MIYDKTHLLQSSLILPEQQTKATALIQSCADPIPALIAQGCVHVAKFYPELARAYDLPYYPSLQVNLSSHMSIVQSIPIKVISQHLLFPFELDHQLYIATSSPFISEESCRELLTYTEYQTYHLVISPPPEIFEAINNSFYAELSVATEDRIHVWHPELSTKTYSTKLVPKVFPIATMALWTALLFIIPYYMSAATFIVLNLIYLLINPLKIFIFLKSLHPHRELAVSEEQISHVTSSELPHYTILVPLMHEEKVIPHLVRSLLALDYPAEKLDIKFIVELGDDQTIRALQHEGVGASGPDASVLKIAAQLVRVPKGSVLTKPRSCNYALAYARGTFTVIYDAEDNPEPDQLKKAYTGFLHSTLDTVCIQARLNFYNSRQNILTRLFALEYGFWFDYYLPGLHETVSPIPLGGTSNHFVTAYLKHVGTWDPYNVTEDADLGLRLFRYKFKTLVMNSYTYEEANANIFSWIKQRTRWQKGYLLTFLVHTSHPRRFLKELGVKNALFSIVTFGSSFFLPLLNPLLWVMFFLTMGDQRIFGGIIPAWFGYVTFFNLLVGNLTYIIVHLVAAGEQKRWDLLPFVFLLPLYWFGISIATIRAIWQFGSNPFYWEKTKHGLHLPPATLRGDAYYKFQ